MPNRYIFLSLLIVFALIEVPAALSQDSSGSRSAYPEGARPDIPGKLGVEFGFVLVPDIPEEMKTNFFGTNMFTGYYKYDFNIGDSKFSVHPGVAVSSIKYSFNDNITITSVNSPDGYINTLIGLDSTIDGSIKKSLFKTTYLEIPLEFTFRTNKELPNRAAKFTVGARGGIRIDSKTKFKYSQDGLNKTTKQKERFGANPFSVVLIGRIGYGSFNLFYTYSLLPVFEGDKGPLGTDTQQMNFGIGLDIF